MNKQFVESCLADFQAYYWLVLVQVIFAVFETFVLAVIF